MEVNNSNILESNLFQVWRRLLRIRSIYFHPLEQYHGWIKFASLCRQEGQLNLARKTLEELLGKEVRPRLQISSDVSF